jgi:hypothetical protein
LRTARRGVEPGQVDIVLDREGHPVKRQILGAGGQPAGLLEDFAIVEPADPDPVIAVLVEPSQQGMGEGDGIEIAGFVGLPQGRKVETAGLGTPTHYQGLSGGSCSGSEQWLCHVAGRTARILADQGGRVE